jgi:Protein of unknown function (DUF1566)
MQEIKLLKIRIGYWSLAGLVATSALVACGGGGGTPENELPAAASNFRLPHTGITASQCYKEAGVSLVACDSAEAIALSGAGKQDGMYINVNAMSYSEVPGHSREECVKDNVTGLVWEGKTVSGLRAGSNTYTNYDSTTQAQKYTGNDINEDPIYVSPSLAEVNAMTNTVGYATYVNSIALCGYTNWRLPLVEELQTIVDYGKTTSGPMLDTTWFSNTQQSAYASAAPVVGDSSKSWGVGDGVLSTYPRSGSYPVRLVRNSQ